MDFTQDIISFGDYIFNFKKHNEYYIVICESADFAKWIDSINMYSITKKASKEKLIDKIKSKLNLTQDIVEKKALRK